jgi:chromosome segregation ATPase
MNHHQVERCHQEDVNLEGLRARLAEATRKQAQVGEEVSTLESQIANCERTNLIRQHEMDIRRLREAELRYIAERERLIGEIMSLKGWNSDLERGNLELQSVRGKLEHDLVRLLDERNSAIHALRHHEAKLYTITQAFEILGGPEAEARAAAAAASAPSPTEYDHRAHKDKEDLDAWVNKKFAIDASNEDQLKGLVEDLTKSGLEGLEGKIRNLVGFVNQVGVERQRQQTEWTSKLFSASRRETQTPEVDKSHGK